MIPEKSVVEKIIKELQKVMRIVDIDIIYEPCTKAEMLLKTGEQNNVGYYSFNQRRNCALVYLNIEHDENKVEWYNTIVHELFHIQTMPYRSRQVELFTFVDLDAEKEKEVERDVTDYYEGVIDSLARMFVGIYPLDKFDFTILE